MTTLAASLLVALPVAFLVAGLPSASSAPAEAAPFPEALARGSSRMPAQCAPAPVSRRLLTARDTTLRPRVVAGVCISRAQLRDELQQLMQDEIKFGFMSQKEAQAWYQYCLRMIPGYYDESMEKKLLCPTVEAKRQMDRAMYMLRRWGDLQPTCRQLALQQIEVMVQHEPATITIENKFESGAVKVTKLNGNYNEDPVLVLKNGQKESLETTMSAVYVLRTNDAKEECIDVLRVTVDKAPFEVNDYYMK